MGGGSKQSGKGDPEFERFFLAKTLTAAMDILCAVALASPEGHR